MAPEVRRPFPEAFEGLLLPYRYKAFYGGRGSAKSHSFAETLVSAATRQPLRIVCAREIQNSLRDSVKQLIEDKIKALGVAGAWDCQDKVTRGINGSQFTYIGMWRNPDALKSLEGADIFWGEEASTFSERSLKIVRPTMRKPGSELWFSWNPEFDHDAVDRFFRGPQGPPPDSLVQAVTWADNPWFKGSPLHAEMEFDYASDPAKAAHVWGGAYVTAVEGAYFAKQLADARQDERIGAVAADPLMQKRAFWDLGVSDSTAIWVAQFVAREIRVLDYCEGQGQPLSYYANWLRSSGHGDALCVLPHDGARRDGFTAIKFEDHLRQANFQVQTIQNQGKGAAMQRIEAARRLFPSIWFNEDTTRDGLKCLAAYHERVDDKRNIGLGPEHDWASHGCFDGATKLLTRYGMCRIDSLPETGEVMTPCGWKQYIHPRITKRRAPLVEVLFSGGFTVKCTPDHLFLTASGWRSAESLMRGSSVLSSLTRSRSISTAASIACGRARNTCRAAVGAFIERFGRLLSDQSQRVAISTTAMATPSTTSSRTSNAWMPASTLLNREQSEQRAMAGSAIALVNERQTGTDQRKVGSGTDSTLSGPKAGPNGSGSRKTVLSAAFGSMHSCARAALHRSTAAQFAKPLPIVGVSALGETADVWDITVPDGHMFTLQNGAVVHNSDAFGLMCIAYEAPRDAKKPRDFYAGAGGWMG